MKLLRTSAVEFDKLARNTDLGAEARAMARRVLVDGLGQSAAAKEFGTSKQRVDNAVRVIRREHERAAEGPGWVEVTITMPDALSRRLGPLMKELQASHDPMAEDLVLGPLLRALDRASRSLAADQAESSSD